jgi:ABC-type Fe3+-hydroxamate transport system substrate-binding protein
MDSMNAFPALAAPPERIVSLVPSMTESLFDLGLGEKIVGVTDFCVLPAEGTARLPHVGGTKNPDVEKIVALAPDLVIGNQEENGEAPITALGERGVAVWLTFPRSVEQALADLHVLAAVYGSRQIAMQIDWLGRSSEWARAANGEASRRAFCPIWRDTSRDDPRWWMTFCGETYASDVLAACGGTNVFAGRRRRYPLEAEWGEAAAEGAAGRDDRYPRVTPDEIAAAQPEVILVPNEPCSFGEADQALLGRIFSVRGQTEPRIMPVDGKLLFWHGTHLAKSLVELPALMRQ